METKRFISTGKNLKKARVYLKGLGYGTEERQKILDKIRHDIPSARVCNCKFMLGLTRMYIEGQLSSPEMIFALNDSLRYISDDAHNMDYSNDLNGLSASEITTRFKTVIEESLERDMKDSTERTSDMKRNPDYRIVPINDFKSAEKYREYTSWCVTQSEGSYSSYTSDGAGRFYFCLKKGFEKMARPKECDNPLDEYGLSMIAVSVNMDGGCNTITCRYNHDCGGNDSVMTVQDLEKLLGDSFYSMFPPYTEAELKERGKYISKNIGKYYLDLKTEREGIVAAVDKDERPTIILSLDDQRVMNWYDAMEYNKTLKNGWHVPTKDELESVWFIKGWNNVITKKINDGIKRYNETIYDRIRLVQNDCFVEWTKESGDVEWFDATKEVMI